MGCNSNLNTLNELRGLNLIDIGNRIPSENLPKVKELIKEYTNSARQNFDIQTEGEIYTIESSTLNGTTVHTLKPNTELFSEIDEQLLEDEEFDYMADFTVDQLVPDFKKYIEFKESLITRLKYRLNQIKILKDSYATNPERLKILESHKRDIEFRLIGNDQVPGLEIELQALKTGQGITSLEFLAEKDIERLSYLVDSTDSQDLAEAREIITFYDKLGTFSVKEPHILFPQDQIFNSEGDLIADPKVINGLKALKDQVNKYNNKVRKKEQEAITRLTNRNRKVRDTFGDKVNFRYEDLFHKEDGLKDLNFVDMYTMDITNGIFKDNGIIPQVMMNVLQNEYESKLVFAKSVEEQINEMQSEVESKLHMLGYGQNIINNSNEVLYDLFRAKNDKGLYTDGITQRFTSVYQDFLNTNYTLFSNKIRKAQLEADPKIKASLYNEAYQQRLNRLKSKTEMLDLKRLPELMSSKEAQGFNVEAVADEAYVQKMKDLLGENGYQEEIDKQKKLLLEYKANLEVEIDTAIAEEGVTDQEALSPKAKLRIKGWETRNNPFTFMDSYTNDTKLTHDNRFVNASLRFNHMVPKKISSKLELKNGKVIQKEGTATNFYEERFNDIDNDPTLKKFHNLLMEVSEKMYESLPPEVRKKFNTHSIPQLEKNFKEHVLTAYRTAEGNFLGKITTAFKEMMNFLISKNLTSGVMSNISWAPVDVNGKPQYQVNSNFLKSNKVAIDTLYSSELLRLKQALGSSLKKLDSSNPMSIAQLTEDAVVILAENLGIEASRDALAARIGITKTTEFNVSKLLKEAVTHQIVASNTLDLPKIMKFYSYVSMEYAARQKVLPLITMLKDHYQEMKSPSTTNVGESIVNAKSKETRLEGLRVNANKQMESWFERAVLGNYNPKQETDTRLRRALKVPATKSEKMKRFEGVLLGKKFLTTEEKEARRRLNQALKNLNKEIKEAEDIEEFESVARLQSAKERVVNNLDNLGKSYSAHAAMDGIFRFIRFKGLGFNLSSGITNFLEGQISNFIAASSGDYFTPEKLYEANKIILSPTKYAYADQKKKAKLLMSRYRILQDARNELQKAESKNTFLKKTRNTIADPFFITTYVEHRNQSPLMVAKLMDTYIKGKDGSTSSVWDALNSEGMLKENFQTKANIKNWQDADGPAYQDFSSTMRKMIVNVHGDYDELRGNMASETHMGKAMLMFKRWMTRQFYQRFASEQSDIEAEMDLYKGRYRSHNATTAGIHGLLVGTMFLGPIAGIVAGIAGAASGHMFATGNNKVSGIGFGKQILRDLSRISPVGRQKATQGRNQFIEDLRKAGVSERDIRNMMANSAEAALMFGLMLLTLLAKAAFKDNDDDDINEDAIHNLIVNRLNQIMRQTTMYTNPVELTKSTLAGSDLSVIRFSSDVFKFFNTLLNEDWTYQAGPMAGQSRIRKDFARAFSPSLTKDWISGDGILSLGFNVQTKKQFEKLYIDDWFEAPEKLAKRQTRGMRSEYRYELKKSEKYTEKEISKMVNKRFPPKKRDQTYSELLIQYETSGR
jgi:hypothetical protein